MHYHYPSPDEVGINKPPMVRKQMFDDGFCYGLKGGRFERIEHFRFSFRMGVRAAKLYLRQVRRSRGIIEFPQHWKFRVRASFGSPSGCRGRVQNA